MKKKSIIEKFDRLLSLNPTLKFVRKQFRVARNLNSAMSDALGKFYFGLNPVHENMQFHSMGMMDILKSSGNIRAKYMFWYGDIPRLFSITARTIHVDKEPNPLERRT